MSGSLRAQPDSQPGWWERPPAALISRPFLGQIRSSLREVRTVEVAGDLDRLDGVDNWLQLRRDVVMEANRDAMGLLLGRQDPSPERVLWRRPPLIVEQGRQLSCGMPLPRGNEGLGRRRVESVETADGRAS